MRHIHFHFAGSVTIFNRRVQGDEHALAGFAVRSTKGSRDDGEKLLAVIVGEAQAHGVTAKNRRPELDFVHGAPDVPRC